ncbi:hypothetical protein O181_111354 [Austropuccinia psidii MF-1]|uniref:Uncharacterized protein n=1 Tax=Austropuccinia psidii MF-1 TaxID=1389203 RepID=A0A9Q3PRQ4_9BASI|nr:hypothetical protein [Austropuccinia psidii MF-1]
MSLSKAIGVSGMVPNTKYIDCFTANIFSKQFPGKKHPILQDSTITVNGCIPKVIENSVEMVESRKLPTACDSEGESTNNREGSLPTGTADLKVYERTLLTYRNHSS